MYKLSLVLWCTFSHIIVGMEAPAKTLIQQVKAAQETFNKAEEQFKKLENDTSIAVGKTLSEKKITKLKEVREQFVTAFTELYAPTQCALELLNDNKSLSDEEIDQLCSILGSKDATQATVTKALYERSNFTVTDRINAIQGWLYPIAGTFRSSITPGLFMQLRELRNKYEIVAHHFDAAYLSSNDSEPLSSVGSEITVHTNTPMPSDAASSHSESLAHQRVVPTRSKKSTSLLRRLLHPFKKNK